MKKILITAAGLLSMAYGQGKLETAGDTRIVTTPDTRLVLDNLHFQHNSQVPQINGVIRFTGNATTQFSGAVSQQVYAIEIDKAGGAELVLQQPLTVDNHIRFINGRLNLMNTPVTLNPLASLQGESETSRAYTNGTGYLSIMVPMSSPSKVNPGNLGILVSSAANLGAVTVRRGHRVQTGSGMATSITRYFDLVPTNNTGLGAAVEFQYFDSERNGLDEPTFILHESSNGGSEWSPIGFDQRSSADNRLLKNNLASLHRYTVSSATGIVLPVTEMQFTATRLNAQTVKLTWITAQETANKGFYLERRRENEATFSTIHFAPSKAPGGTSTTPLHYNKVDTNSFAGKTWYRLRQEDLNGKSTYSLVEMVDGVKDKPAKLTAWPVPAPSEFSVQVEGIEKDKLQVYDLSGRLCYETTIKQGQAVRIGNLAPGTYIVRLAGASDITQKVVVLGGASH